ncbi:DCL1, partial [Symbiodinium pilosum]
DKLGTADAHAIEEVEKAFGYRFRNPQLLAALRASPNGARCVPFQRLEFLGDAVLLVAVCCHVMQECPEFDEGYLSETLHAFICNSYLSRKLVRRFGQAQNLASVFFPGASSPQRMQLPGYVKYILNSEAETDYVIGQRASGVTAVTAAAASTCMRRMPSFMQNQVPEAAVHGNFKFVADSYE